jgi:hypothetical protein
MLARQYAAAMSMLRGQTRYDDIVVCVLDPTDSHAAALLRAVGGAREAEKAVALSAAKGGIPTVVNVLPLALIVDGVRRRWPSIADRMQEPMEACMVKPGADEAPLVRAICMAAGGISYTAMPVDLSAAADMDDPTGVPRVVRRVIETMGSELRAEINKARPDGRRQVAVVGVGSADGRIQLKIRIADTAHVVDGLRREEPALAKIVGEQPDLGFITVVFYLEDERVYTMPMKLDVIAS